MLTKKPRRDTLRTGVIELPYLLVTSAVQIVVLLSYLPPNVTRPLFTVLTRIAKTFIERRLMKRE